MSLSERDRPHHRRRYAALAGALALSVLAAGCVRPLYGENTLSVTGAGSVRSALASIDVPMIPDRLGHTLRNDLGFLLEGRDPPRGPKTHRLLVNVRGTVLITSVSSTLQRADSATVQGTAAYSLVPLAGGAAVVSGNVTANATYERTPQRFASLRAATDARDRVARTLADLIHGDLAAQLARRNPG